VTATGGVGRPGETGALVPGSTALGPTRPAPYFNRHPNMMAPGRTGGQRGVPVYPYRVDTTGAVRVDTVGPQRPPGAPGDTTARSDTTNRGRP
jgi:hypothetical protein